MIDTTVAVLKNYITINVMWHVRQAEIIRNNQTSYDHAERVIYTYGLAV